MKEDVVRLSYLGAGLSRFGHCSDMEGKRSKFKFRSQKTNFWERNLIFLKVESGNGLEVKDTTSSVKS